jgi:hypothetical protein
MKCMSKKDLPLDLRFVTYIDSAEGMARRVLHDLEKSGLSKEELARVYQSGFLHGGFNCDNLIKLGTLLQELSGIAEKITDI